MIWFISDTHFCHANILKFTNKTGEPVRPGFKNVWDMNQVMIHNWNKVVSPSDKVYHLGDFAVGVQNPKELEEISHYLNGHKRLILGNHDRLNLSAYKCFEKIELWTGGKFKQYNFVCSHIPLRKDQMRDGEVNVHGHIHQNLMKEPGYINVCVEHTDYTPVSLDEIVSRIENN